MLSVVFGIVALEKNDMKSHQKTHHILRDRSETAEQSKYYTSSSLDRYKQTGGEALISAWPKRGAQIG